MGAFRRLVERETTRLISEVLEAPEGTRPDSLLAPMLTHVIRVISQSELHQPRNLRALSQALTELSSKLDTLRVVDESRSELLRIELSSRRLAAQAAWRRPPPKVLAPLQPAHQAFEDLVARMCTLHPHLSDLWGADQFH